MGVILAASAVNSQAGHHHANLFDLGPVIGWEGVDDSSAKHDRNPVGKGKRLGEIPGDEQNTGTLAGLQKQIPDLFGCSDIQSLGRLFCHDESRAPEEFSSQHEFLQIASGKLPGRLPGIRRLNVEGLNGLGCLCLCGGFVQPGPREKCWRVVSRKLSTRSS